MVFAAVVERPMGGQGVEQIVFDVPAMVAHAPQLRCRRNTSRKNPGGACAASPPPRQIRTSLLRFVLLVCATWIVTRLSTIAREAVPGETRPVVGKPHAAAKHENIDEERRNKGRQPSGGVCSGGGGTLVPSRMCAISSMIAVSCATLRLQN